MSKTREEIEAIEWLEQPEDFIGANYYKYHLRKSIPIVLNLVDRLEKENKELKQKIKEQTKQQAKGRNKATEDELKCMILGMLE